MNQSNEINELIGALAKAQGEMTAAAKDCTNPHFKSRYADLASVWDACRLPLSKNGLAVTQTMIIEGETQYLLTLLGHSSGQWISSRIPIRVETRVGGNAIQQLGSILTYLRRYSLAAIVGVAPDEDDDGNAAQGYQAAKASLPLPQKILVNPQQITLLSSLIEKCEPNVRESIWDFLHGPQVGVASIADLTIQQFEKIKPLVERKIREDAQRS